MGEQIVISAILQELERRVKGTITANHNIVNGDIMFYVRYNSTTIGHAYKMSREDMFDLRQELKDAVDADIIDAVVEDIVFYWKERLIEELFNE